MYKLSQKLLYVFFALSLGISSTHAIAIVDPFTNQTTTHTQNPTNSQIPQWNTGWGATGITGWDYFGRTNTTGQTPGTGNDVMYLGNGWVITANHVFTNYTYPFTSVTIQGTSYNLSGLSYSIVNQTGTNIGSPTDIRLFQITPTHGLLPNLPTLSIRHEPIVVENQNTHTLGTAVVMLGTGGTPNSVTSWGYNRVGVVGTSSPTTTATSPSTSLTTYTDYFETVVSTASTVPSNQAEIVVGDSGGGDFTFNTITQTWELAGINHARSTSMGYHSQMADLSVYATQIESIISIPEPSYFIFLFFGIIILNLSKKKPACG